MAREFVCRDVIKFTLQQVGALFVKVFSRDFVRHALYFQHRAVARRVGKSDTAVEHPFLELEVLVEGGVHFRVFPFLGIFHGVKAVCVFHVETFYSRAGVPRVIEHRPIPVERVAHVVSGGVLRVFVFLPVLGPSGVPVHDFGFLHIFKALRFVEMGFSFDHVVEFIPVNIEVSVVRVSGSFHLSASLPLYMIDPDGLVGFLPRELVQESHFPGCQFDLGCAPVNVGRVVTVFRVVVCRGDRGVEPHAFEVEYFVIDSFPEKFVCHFLCRALVEEVGSQVEIFRFIHDTGIDFKFHVRVGVAHVFFLGVGSYLIMNVSAYSPMFAKRGSHSRVQNIRFESLASRYGVGKKERGRVGIEYARPRFVLPMNIIESEFPVKVDFVDFPVRFCQYFRAEG